MFGVSFVNAKSVEVFDPAECQRAYLAGECLQDVLTSIPVNFILLAAGAGSPQQLFAFRISRLLTARYLYRVYRDWMRHMADDDGLGGMLSTFGIFLLAIHYISCVMHAIGYDEYFIDLADGATWAEHYERLRDDVGYAHPPSESPLETLVSHCTRAIRLETARTLAAAQLPTVFAARAESECRLPLALAARSLSRLPRLLLQRAGRDDDWWACPCQYPGDWLLHSHHARDDDGEPLLQPLRCARLLSVLRRGAASAAARGSQPAAACRCAAHELIVEFPHRPLRSERS
jgi:hypothetical protein